MNVGEPLRNAKEGEVTENERTLEFSDVLRSSQSGHSTLSLGEPDTWGRTTAYRRLKC